MISPSHSLLSFMIVKVFFLLVMITSHHSKLFSSLTSSYYYIWSCSLFEAILMLGSRTKDFLHVSLSRKPLAPSLLTSLYLLQKVISFSEKNILPQTDISRHTLWNSICITHTHESVLSTQRYIQRHVFTLHLAHTLLA